MTDSSSQLPLEKRFCFDPEKKRFHVDLENFSVLSMTDIQKIEFLVAEKLSHLGYRVPAIVNYENFCIDPELLDDYAAMVNRLMEHFYSGVARYTTSHSLRDKLACSLQHHHVKPNFYASDADAEKSLDD